MLLLKLSFLPMMIKVLSKTRRPFLCAFLYLMLIVTNGLIFDVAFGTSWQRVSIEAAKAFGSSALYFWLLNEFESTDGIYYPVLGVGLIAMLLI